MGVVMRLAGVLVTVLEVAVVLQAGGVAVVLLERGLGILVHLLLLERLMRVQIGLLVLVLLVLLVLVKARLWCCLKKMCLYCLILCDQVRLEAQ